MKLVHQLSSTDLIWNDLRGFIRLIGSKWVAQTAIDSNYKGQNNWSWFLFKTNKWNDYRQI